MQIPTKQYRYAALLRVMLWDGSLACSATEKATASFGQEKAQMKASPSVALSYLREVSIVVHPISHDTGLWQRCLPLRRAPKQLMVIH